MQQRTLVVIPARMQASRLPGKPLVDIAGEPMIVHVWRRAMAAEIGRVVVATDTEEIVAARAQGRRRGRHDAPRPRLGLRPRVRGRQPGRPRRRLRDHPQPAGRPADLRAEPGAANAWPRSRTRGPHIATIAAEITDEADRTNPNSVKVVGTPTGVPRRLRALYFTRATAPSWRGSALPSLRHLRLSPLGAGAVRLAQALHAREARAARAAARAGGRHAHRRDAR